MFIGNSVEKNLSDMLLDLYHGKKDAYRVIKKIDNSIIIVYLKVIYGIKKNPKENQLCQELVFI